MAWKGFGGEGSHLLQYHIGICVKRNDSESWMKGWLYIMLEYLLVPREVCGTKLSRICCRPANDQLVYSA